MNTLNEQLTPDAGAPRRKGGKPHGEQTFRRRLALLSILPGADQPGLRPAVLAERLGGSGYPCSKRTVERDLVAMERDAMWRDAGIDILQTPDPSDPRAKLWGHKGRRKLTLLRAPSGEDAMMIGLMAQELQAFLPESALDVLSSYQPSSESVLKLPGHSAHARYHRKIRSLPDGPLTIAPPLAAGHLRAVNEALLREEQIDIHYHAGSRHADRHYRLHPLGMVKKGLFFWLIAFKEEDGKLVEPVRPFRMDRVRSVERRETQPVAATLPELQQVLETGLLGFFPKNLVHLRLRSAPGKAGDELVANYRDTPLSRDQRITELPDGGFQLEARVRHTRELVWMLQGQAHLLEVLEPRELRQELQKFAARVAERYMQEGGTG